MEAEAFDALPTGPQWQYEPKWDGFRAVAAALARRLLTGEQRLLVEAVLVGTAL